MMIVYLECADCDFDSGFYRGVLLGGSVHQGHEEKGEPDGEHESGQQEPTHSILDDDGPAF